MEQQINEEENPITDYVNEQRELDIRWYKEGIIKARNALFWVAGILFLSEMIAVYTVYGTIATVVVIIPLVIAVIFIGLALWTKQKPYTAIVLGLVAFIAYLLLGIIVNMQAEGGIGLIKALMQGIIFKVAILAILIRALPNAKALQEEIKVQGK